MREPNPVVRQQLKNYDRELDVVWCERDETGHQVERWRVLRKGQDGRMRHIMFVMEPDGSYRPLDNRVLEKLVQCDSHRYVDADDLMDAMDARQDLSLRVGIQGVLERRYWEGMQEMGERLQKIACDSPYTAPSEKLTTDHLKRLDHAQAVRAAYEKGKGIIVKDKKLDCPMVLPGSDS